MSSPDIELESIMSCKVLFGDGWCRDFVEIPPDLWLRPDKFGLGTYHAKSKPKTSVGRAVSVQHNYLLYSYFLSWLGQYSSCTWNGWLSLVRVTINPKHLYLVWDRQWLVLYLCCLWFQLVWMNPSGHVPSIEWDSTMCVANSAGGYCS